MKTDKQIVLPSDPATQKKIKDLCTELSASMCRSEGEHDFQSEAIKDMAKDTGIPAAFLRKTAKLWHKQNIAAVTADQESVVELYETIFGPIGE